jgi:hypothetical protein
MDDGQTEFGIRNCEAYILAFAEARDEIVARPCSHAAEQARRELASGWLTRGVPRP